MSNSPTGNFSQGNGSSNLDEAADSTPLQNRRIEPPQRARQRFIPQRMYGTISTNGKKL